MYFVVISGPAERDLEQQHDWWAEHRSAQQAARWHAGFSKAIKALCQHPERCQFASENGQWTFDVRQLTFGLGRGPSHRAIFKIAGNQVIVLRTRHLAQANLEFGDIEA